MLDIITIYKICQCVLLDMVNIKKWNWTVLVA